MRLFAAAIIFALLGSGASAASVESWEQLKAIIKDNNVTNIDDLLERLPPEYTKGYTLIYRTRALNQESVSPRRPRVVLFGQNAKFVLVYNSHPTGGKAKPGDVEVIETLEFDAATGRSFLRELQFDGTSVPNLDAVKENPDRCLACHAVTSSPPMEPKYSVRGLWDPYNSWAGVYGSLSRNDADFMKFDTREHRNFQEFLAEKPNNPRYEHLRMEVKNLSALNIREFKPMHANDALTFSNGYGSNPNQMLGMLLADYNFHRVGNILAELAPAGTRAAFQYLVKGLTLDEEKFVKDDNPVDGTNGTFVADKTYDCLNMIASFLPESMPKVSFAEFAAKFHLKAQADYIGRKALVERDNMGLTKHGAGFDQNDPFDEQREDPLGLNLRRLRFDSIDPVTYFFKNRNTGKAGHWGGPALYYLFYLMDLPSQDLNTAIVRGDNVPIDTNYVLSGSVSISYGGVTRCYNTLTGKVKKKNATSDSECTSGGADEFFMKYLPKSFYQNGDGNALDEELKNLNSCDQLASSSKAALTAYFAGRE